MVLVMSAFYTKRMKAFSEGEKRINIGEVTLERDRLGERKEV